MQKRFRFTLFFKKKWKAVKKGKIKPEEGNVLADSNRDLGNFILGDLSNYTIKAHSRFFMNPVLWFRTLAKAISERDFRFVNLGLRMISGFNSHKLKQKFNIKLYLKKI